MGADFAPYPIGYRRIPTGHVHIPATGALIKLAER
jgi:hypothetical protein